MILHRKYAALGLAFAGVVVFAATWTYRKSSVQDQYIALTDRVVLSAPIQLILSGGDRFLAANLEAIRAAATTSDAPGAEKDNASFSIRAREVVSRLNPCHEDNYYYGNALLTWGGAAVEGNILLRRAMDCRGWDELPAFFYGFNKYFFERDVAEAVRALEIGAQRSVRNAAPLRKLAIMFTAGEFDDEQSALEYLETERNKTDDPRLKSMLEKRVGRLAGLLALRDAQRRFESRFGRQLNDPTALIETGLLETFPVDPMGIGYEFHEGRFRMREIQVAGMEHLR